MRTIFYRLFFLALVVALVLGGAEGGRKKKKGNRKSEGCQASFSYPGQRIKRLFVGDCVTFAGAPGWMKGPEGMLRQGEGPCFMSDRGFMQCYIDDPENSEADPIMGSCRCEMKACGC